MKPSSFFEEEKDVAKETEAWIKALDDYFLLINMSTKKQVHDSQIQADWGGKTLVEGVV